MEQGQVAFFNEKKQRSAAVTLMENSILLYKG